MRQIIIISLCLIGMSSCFPKEGENCHFGVTVSNYSEKDIYAEYIHLRPDVPSLGKDPTYGVKRGYIDYYLVLQGETNNQICRDERYCLEDEIRDAGDIRFFILDVEIVDVTPWEELKATRAGILFERIYTLAELQALDFKITYPDSND